MPDGGPPRVVVGGEALVDLVMAADGSITPKLGGGPYNVARALGRLGVASHFMAAISTDRFGEQLLGGLTDDGVAIDLVQRTNAPTTLAVAQIGDDGSASYRFYLDGTSAPALHVAPHADGAPAACHVGTLGLVLQPMADTLETYVASLPATTMVVVDPNCRASVPFDRDEYLARVRRMLGRSHVVKISTDDADYLAPGLNPVEIATEIVSGEWSGGSAVPVVLVTAGSKGTTIVTAHGQQHVDAEPVTVADTIGAGDSFGAAFIAWWLAGGRTVEHLDDGAALRAAVAAAQQVAAITCSRVGADPPRRAELPAGWSA
jgi:fructokinase